MFDYRQYLREATLKAVSHQPVADKARAMNMIESIIEGELSADQIVQAIDDDTLPVRYVPSKT